MKNLRDQLREVLPGILPARPEDAIKGTELIRLVKYQLRQEYSEATLRYHFSIMCCDPASPIAKVDQGQGYYLRRYPRVVPETSENPSARQATFEEPEDEADAPTRDWRNWEKVRQIYRRHLEADARYPFLLETGPDQRAELEWIVPDAIDVEWNLGEAEDYGLSLDENMLEFRRTLGASPFKLRASRIISRVSAATVRREFFRSLGSAAWAHAGDLVIAIRPDEQRVLEELRLLGQRFGHGVLILGLNPRRLDEYPSPEGIQLMKPSEIEALLSELRTIRLTDPMASSQLDWNSLKSVRSVHTGPDKVIGWTNRCCREKRVLPIG